MYDITQDDLFDTNVTIYNKLKDIEYRLFVFMSWDESKAPAVYISKVNDFEDKIVHRYPWAIFKLESTTHKFTWEMIEESVCEDKSGDMDKELLGYLERFILICIARDKKEEQRII